MGVEVVHYQDDPLGLRVTLVHQLLDLMRPVDLRAVLCYVYPTPARKRLHKHEHVGYPTPLVLVVFSLGPPRLHRQGRPDVPEHLLGSLVHAHLRTAGVVGASVDLEYVLHAPDELGVSLGRDRPLLPQVRLEFVFLRVLNLSASRPMSKRSWRVRRSTASSPAV